MHIQCYYNRVNCICARIEEFTLKEWWKKFKSIDDIKMYFNDYNEKQSPPR